MAIPFVPAPMIIPTSTYLQMPSLDNSDALSNFKSFRNISKKDLSDQP